MSGLPALVVSRGSFDGPSTLPRALFTGTGSDPRPRLRVDQAQTSFYENREFRAYHEFNVSAGQSIWLRWVFPTDVLIHGRDITLTGGQLRYALYSNTGTPAGTWTPKTMIRVNNLATAPVYVGSATLAYGGTLSGATELDCMVAVVGTGGNGSTATVGISEGGLAAGTYYVEIRSVGAQACTGVYRVNYEEYQPMSSLIATL